VNLGQRGQHLFGVAGFGPGFDLLEVGVNGKVFFIGLLLCAGHGEAADQESGCQQ